jgi:P27 family predicted phage terminase small subunit
MRGRTPKPRDQRQGKSAPRLIVVPDKAPDVPPAPDGLLRASQRDWAAFWRSPSARAVDPGDLQRLERWILDRDEWRRVTVALRKERVVAGSMGQPRLSPLAQYRSSLEQSLSKAEEQFGMSPFSRARLGIAVGEFRRTAAELNAATAQAAEPLPDDLLDEYEEAT